jgi:hypothetical protein
MRAHGDGFRPIDFSESRKHVRKKASYDMLLILFRTAKMAALAVEMARPFKLGHV